MGDGRVRVGVAAQVARLPESVSAPVLRLLYVVVEPARFLSQLAPFIFSTSIPGNFLSISSIISGKVSMYSLMSTPQTDKIGRASCRERVCQYV